MLPDTKAVPDWLLRMAQNRFQLVPPAVTRALRSTHVRAIRCKPGRFNFHLWLGEPKDDIASASSAAPK